LPIERFWPEVNMRVNYPIKKILVELDNNQRIDMECDIQKFCVSAVACRVAQLGLNRVIEAWNLHPISGN